VFCFSTSLPFIRDGQWDTKTALKFLSTLIGS